MSRSRFPRTAIAQGRRVQQLFPGFCAEIEHAGAIPISVGESWGFLGRFGWAVPFAPTMRVFSASRDFLEWHVRRRVKALDHVRFVQESVQRLVARDGRVLGVELDGGGTVDADLVVDASGRGSQARTWLADLDYEPPKETVVDAGVIYTSRMYEGHPNLPNGWKALTVLWAPPQHKRGAFLVPLEGRRMLLTLAGGAGDAPEPDEKSFEHYIRTLRTEVVRDAVAGARPIGDIHRSRSTMNRFRHFERLKRMPAGFVVLGDAAVAFNPTYGQGMSVAAIEASALREAASKGPVDALPFQRKLAGTVKDAWLAATGEDFRFEEAKGSRPAATRVIHRYMDGVQRLAITDASVQALLAGVYLLERPLLELFRPAIALRALPARLEVERLRAGVGAGTRRGGRDESVSYSHFAPSPE